MISNGLVKCNGYYDLHGNKIYFKVSCLTNELQLRGFQDMTGSVGETIAKVLVDSIAQKNCEVIKLERFNLRFILVGQIDGCSVFLQFNTQSKKFRVIVISYDKPVPEAVWTQLSLSEKSGDCPLFKNSGDCLLFNKCMKHAYLLVNEAFVDNFFKLKKELVSLDERDSVLYNDNVSLCAEIKDTALKQTNIEKEIAFCDMLRENLGSKKKLNVDELAKINQKKVDTCDDLFEIVHKNLLSQQKVLDEETNVLCELTGELQFKRYALAESHKRFDARLSALKVERGRLDIPKQELDSKFADLKAGVAYSFVNL